MSCQFYIFKLQTGISLTHSHTDWLTRQLDFLDQNHPVSTRINPYQPVSTRINPYQPVSTRINQYQPVSNRFKPY